MTDTTLEITNKQREIIYQKTLQERFQIGVELINFGRELVISNIKKTNSNISEIDLKIALLKRYYENQFSKEEFELIVQSMIDYYNKQFK